MYKCTSSFGRELVHLKMHYTNLMDLSGKRFIIRYYFMIMVIDGPIFIGIVLKITLKDIGHLRILKISFSFRIGHAYKHTLKDVNANRREQPFMRQQQNT